MTHGKTLSYSHYTQVPDLLQNNCYCSVLTVMPDSLPTQGLPHARLPCPSPSPGVCSNSYSLSQ